MKTPLFLIGSLPIPHRIFLSFFKKEILRKYTCKADRYHSKKYSITSAPTDNSKVFIKINIFCNKCLCNYSEAFCYIEDKIFLTNNYLKKAKKVSLNIFLDIMGFFLLDNYILYPKIITSLFELSTIIKNLPYRCRSPPPKH